MRVQTPERFGAPVSPFQQEQFMAHKTLQDLYIEELNTARALSIQMAQLINDMIEAADNDDLASALQDGFRHISAHAETLACLVEDHGEAASDAQSPEAAMLADHARRRALDPHQPSAICDAAIISQMQRLIHYAMAINSVASKMAEVLGLEEDAEQLSGHLEALYGGDELLDFLGETAVIPQAAFVEAEDEAVDEEAEKDNRRS